MVARPKKALQIAFVTTMVLDFVQGRRIAKIDLIAQLRSIHAID